DLGREHDTDETTRAGTLRYMAPERLVGQVADARSDQFSFCVALWEVLAGRNPFEGRRSKSACCRS
ncbi:MAG: protein kinase, partial [Deltaproteobacteria bacterium]|nr:protein kinase [Deltaproteobacteria bacterium]